MIHDSLRGARIEVEHLCDLSIELEPPQIVPTPRGMRSTFIVASGRVDGPALSGEVLPGGGDWVLFGDDGVGRLDVRATIRAESGALVHLEIGGIADLRGGAAERLGAGEHLPWDEMYVRCTARLETSDEELGWLSSIVVVGVLELGPNHVDYRLFRVL